MVARGAPGVDPDGRAVVFVRREGRRNELVQKTLARPDEEIVLHVADASLFPTHWTPDGATIFTAVGAAAEVWMLPIRNPSAGRRLVSGTQAQVSPDGRGLAYSSSETGTSQVYVQAFPDGGETRIISRQGGHMPRWNEDGAVLRFVTIVGDLVEVRFDAGTGVAHAPRTLFRTAITTRNPALRHAPAGDRVLAVEDHRFEAPVRVGLNWPALLAR
jgi:Tol biopolymer transport system component